MCVHLHTRVVRELVEIVFLQTLGGNPLDEVCANTHRFDGEGASLMMKFESERVLLHERKEDLQGSIM